MKIGNFSSFLLSFSLVFALITLPVIYQPPILPDLDKPGYQKCNFCMQRNLIFWEVQCKFYFSTRVKQKWESTSISCIFLLSYLLLPRTATSMYVYKSFTCLPLTFLSHTCSYVISKPAVWYEWFMLQGDCSWD